MTLPLIKHFFKRDIWTMKLLNIMNAVRLSRFCWFFTVRQGTMMVAVIELSLASFILFLLLLCVTHAEDIVAMASADLQQLEDIHWPSTFVEEPPTFIANNEKRMLSGQHLAFVIRAFVCSGLVFTSIHFVFCLLLFLGALKKRASLLLPWISTALLSLISGAFLLGLLAFLPLQDCKLGIYAAGISILSCELYAWLTVYSYYRELKT